MLSSGYSKQVLDRFKRSIIQFEAAANVDRPMKVMDVEPKLPPYDRRPHHRRRRRRIPSHAAQVRPRKSLCSTPGAEYPGDRAPTIGVDTELKSSPDRIGSRHEYRAAESEREEADDQVQQR